MYCKYCGAELKETDRFCPFCGGTVKNSESQSGENTESKSTYTPTELKGKAKKNPIKVIAIVVLVSVLVNAIFFGAVFAMLKTAGLSLTDILTGAYASDFDDVLDDALEDAFDDAFDDFDDAFDDFDDAFDDFDDEVEQRVKDKLKDKKNSKHDTSGFIPGKISKKDRSYSSDMTGLEFTLPKEWEVFSREEINELNDHISDDELYVDDFYAEDTLKSSMICISYYNKDYYSEYKDLSTFVKSVKSDILETYAEDGNRFDLDFADDSKLTLADKTYTQIAVQITDNTDGDCYYSYEIMGEVDNYYVEITIIAFSLDDIGEVIDLMK